MLYVSIASKKKFEIIAEKFQVKKIIINSLTRNRSMNKRNKPANISDTQKLQQTVSINAAAKANGNLDL